MKQYSITLNVETLELSEEQIHQAVQRGLDSMPETPYLGYFNLKIEAEGEQSEFEEGS